MKIEKGASDANLICFIVIFVLFIMCFSIKSFYACRFLVFTKNTI